MSDGPARTLHDAEFAVDTGLVAELVAEQFPELSDLPVRDFRSTGTVNTIFLLGDDLYARLPRVEVWAHHLDLEWRWLPVLAPQLTLRVPQPVKRGSPSGSYPYSWSIYRWIRGQPYADDLVVDEVRAAGDLARFIGELRSCASVPGAPTSGRGPLRALDRSIRVALDRAGTAIDRGAALAAWDGVLDAAEWTGPPGWVHGDLLRPNLLVDEGRICAVLDFGCVGVGDPAADVVAAWSVFGPSGREAFRATLDVDDDTWSRARGYALYQAAWIIPYYADTNPEFVRQAIRTVAEVLTP
ncbi:MAG TPA: aminoglycoside phosphotransferase family protein [Acidimicrobiales bacterium]